MNDVELRAKRQCLPNGIFADAEIVGTERLDPFIDLRKRSITMSRSFVNRVSPKNMLAVDPVKK